MPSRVERAFSLIELLVVVGLLGLIAAVALPSLLTQDDSRLQLAAEELALAFRHARSEAVRRGVAHGVDIDAASQTAKVFRLDQSVTPAVAYFDVRHPISKQVFELSFDDGTGPAISAASFQFRLYYVTESSVIFAGGSGVPAFDDNGTGAELQQGYVTLQQGSNTRTVSVLPRSGRVTVQ